MVNPPATLVHSRPNRLSPRQQPPGTNFGQQPAGPDSLVRALARRSVRPAPPAAAVCMVASVTAAPHHPVQRQTLCEGKTGAQFDRQPTAGAPCIVISVGVSPHHPVQRQRHQNQRSGGSSSGRRRGRRRRQAARSGGGGAANSASRRQRHGESNAPTEAIDRGRGAARHSPSESNDKNDITQSPDTVHRTVVRHVDTQRRQR